MKGSGKRVGVGAEVEGEVEGEVGAEEAAAEAAEEALRAAMALDDQAGLGKALLVAAEALLGLGRAQEALPLAEEAEQIFAGLRRRGVKEQRLQATRLTARCLDDLGRGPEALARYEFAIAELAELPAHRRWRWAMAHAEARAATVPLLRAAGRLDEAIDEAIDSINFWSKRPAERQAQALRWRSLLYAELARCLEAKGEVEGAAEAAEMGIADTRRLGTEPDRLAVLLALRGSILAGLGEVAKGEAHLAQAVEAAEKPALRETLAEVIALHAAKPGAPQVLADYVATLRGVPRPGESGEPEADQNPVRPEP